MNKSYIFLLSLSAVTLAACSDGRILEYPEEQPLPLQEISILANVDDVNKTRVVFASTESGIQNSGNFESDAKIAVYVEGGVNMGYAAPAIYTRNQEKNDDNVTYKYPQKFDAATTQYFPTNGGSVNIYAFYPSKSGFLASENGQARSGNLAFSVATDQSTAANYRASDLMFASKASQARTSSDVSLKFFHVLSKVKITIEKGNGFTYDHLKSATVKIKNAYNTANVNLAVTTVEGTTDADCTNRKNALVKNGDAENYYTGTAKADMTLGTLPADMAASATVCAIIPPQVIAASTEFITITLTSTYGSTVFKYKPTSALTFAPGTENTINLTVNSDGISVGGVTINAWGTGLSVNNGSAGF